MVQYSNNLDFYARAKPGSSSGTRRAARYRAGVGDKTPPNNASSWGISLAACVVLFSISCSPHYSLFPEPSAKVTRPMLSAPVAPTLPLPLPMPMPETWEALPAPTTTVPARDIELVRLCENMKLLENDTRHRIAGENNQDVVTIYQRALDERILPSLVRCRNAGVIQ